MRLIQFISIVMILIALYFAALLVFSSNGLMRYHHLSQEVKILHQREQELIRLTKESKNRIENGQNDEKLEESARKNLGMIGQDETIMTFAGE